MSPKPFRFLDLPTEIRTIIYRCALICNDDQIHPNERGEVTHRSDISQACASLLVNKTFNTEATLIIYASHEFFFRNLSSATSFISAIGKHNASHITMLNLGSFTYTEAEAKRIACCAATAMKVTAKLLGGVCSGLELLDFTPEQSAELGHGTEDDVPFSYWTDGAFIAVKALTLAFPWLKYVSYDAGGGRESVRMTSDAAMQVEEEDVPFDIDEEMRKREGAEEALR